MAQFSRRGFLQTLAAATAAVATYDPEQLLWTPGQKTIFLPPEKRFERADLIVDPNEYRDVDWEVDLTEESYQHNLRVGATFDGYDRVNVIGEAGSVRRVDLAALQGRLLQADAKRANARLNEWTRRTVEDV